MTARACIHCGCTDNNACMIRLKDLDLKLVRRVFGRASELTIGANDRIACWWVSTDPPVCSGPACVALHGADVMLERVSRVGA